MLCFGKIYFATCIQLKAPVDTGRKLNVHKTDVEDVLWTSYVRSIYVLCLRGLLQRLFVSSTLKTWEMHLFLIPLTAVLLLKFYLLFNHIRVVADLIVIIVKQLQLIFKACLVRMKNLWTLYLKGLKKLLRSLYIKMGKLWNNYFHKSVY